MCAVQSIININLLTLSGEEQQRGGDEHGQRWEDQRVPGNTAGIDAGEDEDDDEGDADEEDEDEGDDDDEDDEEGDDDEYDDAVEAYMLPPNHSHWPQAPTLHEDTQTQPHFTRPYSY